MLNLPFIHVIGNQMETRKEFNLRFIPYREGELRRDGRGILSCLGEAGEDVAVYRIGTNHKPFFKPIEEWEKLPKVEK